MRLIVASLAVLLPLGSSSALPPAETPRQAPAPTGDKTCERPEIQHAQNPGGPAARKLGELPPGDLVLAVHREVDGCVEPVIVRHDIGQGGSQPKPEAPEPAPGLLPRPL